jgi:hypothetical protein
MKLRIWLVTRDRETWFTGAEIVGLAIVLASASPSLRVLLGLPLLAHLGYRALTSVPLGQIPGRPEWAKQVRRNQDLRSRVVGFLNEMRRVEDLAHNGRLSGGTSVAVERDLAYAKRRMMEAAKEVVRAAGHVESRVPGAGHEESATATPKTEAGPSRTASIQRLMQRTRSGTQSHSGTDA